MSIASRIKGWFQPKNAEEQLLFDQTKFLLSQGPLRDCPKDLYQLRGAGMGTRYAYINPLTFDNIASSAGQFGFHIDDWSARISGSRTLWVFTPLIPEGAVLFSSNQMPGLAELEAEDA